MKKFFSTLFVASVVVVCATLFFTQTASGRKSQFVIGGALVNAGYRMQDHLLAYDFIEAHEHDITPQQIWEEVQRQNDLAAGVREMFPRTTYHPLVAIVACMDARIDTSELLGDTRRYYYILRTAGSVLDAKEAEMLELAVENGVKLVVLATHTDCAAEACAADPELRDRFPALAQAVDTRDVQYQSLAARPAFAERIAKGELLVKQVRIDTETDDLEEE
jgi:carbonic anhydrase